MKTSELSSWLQMKRSVNSVDCVAFQEDVVDVLRELVIDSDEISNDACWAFYQLWLDGYDCGYSAAY